MVASSESQISPPHPVFLVKRESEIVCLLVYVLLLLRILVGWQTRQGRI